MDSHQYMYPKVTPVARPVQSAPAAASSALASAGSTVTAAQRAA